MSRYGLAYIKMQEEPYFTTLFIISRRKTWLTNSEIRSISLRQ